ncbi:MAG: YceI family protein, partial [Chloroflexi bacterium]|nr:YceI family protein [Chloroflexota bacterium]
ILPPPTTASTSKPAATSAPTTSAQPSGDVVRFVLVTGKNEARYRVREQLAGVSLPSDAVGVTTGVTGTITAKTDGTIIPGQSTFRADLSKLKSDRDQRDNYLRNETLETRRYPFADFVATQVKGLPNPPPRSGDVGFQLIGNLTVKNVTKEVTWDVKGKIEGEEFSGLATTSFKFGYFNIAIPRVFTVLSIEDNIKLEIDFRVRHQSG